MLEGKFSQQSKPTFQHYARSNAQRKGRQGESEDDGEESQEEDEVEQ